MTQPKIADAEFPGIILQRVYLLARHRILNGFVLIDRRNIMIGNSIGFFGTQKAQLSVSHALKGLRTGDFVAIMPVDVQLGWSVGNSCYHVPVPYFIE
jgi:hypothetical protein